MLFDHTLYAEKLPPTHVDGAWNDIATWKQRQYMSSVSFSKQVKRVRLNFILEFTLKTFSANSIFIPIGKLWNHVHTKLASTLNFYRKFLLGTTDVWHTIHTTLIWKFCTSNFIIQQALKWIKHVWNMCVTIRAKTNQITTHMFQVLHAKIRNVEKANGNSSVEPKSSFPFKQEPTNTS